MVTALPHSIQLKLEQTLAQWRRWQCEPPLSVPPQVADVLTGGASNFSIRVTSSQRKFVVRIDGVNPLAHGLNRQTEWRALQSASAAGLAPTPRYFNPDLGSLVGDYIQADTVEHTEPAALGRLLASIHRLPGLHARLDLSERILRYEKQLQSTDRLLTDAINTCSAQILDLLYRDRTRPSALVLCHNDLLRANRITVAGRLLAIDWEYCAMGNPWYDIAVVIVGDNLDADASRRLIEAYLHRAPDRREMQLLAHYSCVYRYIELLWYGIVQRGALDVTALEQRLLALRAALNAGAGEPPDPPG